MASHSILPVAKITGKRKRGPRPWSDLPQELLRLIAERLYLVDRIRFRAVCKNWQASPIHDIQLIDKLPWILYYCFSPHHTISSFFGPGRRLPYITEEKRESITEGSLLSNATACASRSGWVLFSQKKKVFEFFYYKLRDEYLYHVYNPLTKRIIPLPSLNLPDHDYDFGCFATFSSDPTSPDCMFFAPTVSYNGRCFFMSSYAIGNKRWEVHNTCPLHAMAYMEGTVYCFNMEKGLSSFHIDTQEWRLLSDERPLINGDWTHVRDFIRGPWYFLAYGGNLHLVYLRELENDEVPKCNILKYDWLDRGWKKMESLEGGVIFVGKPCFGVPAGEETKTVANRVYYFSRQTSRPSFLVYGAAETEEKSEFSRTEIYYEGCPDEVWSLGKSKDWRWALREHGCGMWMEPPFLTS